MIETLPDVAVAGAVALGVGATHGIAHYAAGSADSFEAAGVNAAGIAVVIGAFVATWLILNPGVLPT
jgi:hypothetical protein